MQQIIDRQRSVSRSLAPFGVALAVGTVALLAVMLLG
jgi:hypothetical protein